MAFKNTRRCPECRQGQARYEGRVRDGARYQDSLGRWCTAPGEVSEFWYCPACKCCTPLWKAKELDRAAAEERRRKRAEFWRQAREAAVGIFTFGWLPPILLFAAFVLAGGVAGWAVGYATDSVGLAQTLRLAPNGQVSLSVTGAVAGFFGWVLWTCK